jgi:hypothetical protein
MKLETIRAKAGALLLDMLRPGWANEIKVEQLRLENCNACVLGQLYGDYGIGAEKVFAMRIERDRTAIEAEGKPYRKYDDTLDVAAQDAGFFLSDDRESRKRTTYDNLTKAWKREVAKRTSKKGATA